MRSTVIAFVLALGSSALLTPLVRRLAQRVGAIDHALGSRKVHQAPIPRLGGIAIAAAFFVPIVGLLLVDSGVGQLFRADEREAFGLVAGGVAIALLGVYDDLRGADAKLKFLVQFAVAAFVYACGYRIDVLANPFGPPIALGWFGLPFTMLWIAGVINAINLVDGLDGLAGGVAFISVSVTFVAAVLHGEPLMALFSAALAGAVLGFLRYNFNPASIFMGDTGSMFLGFVLATASVQAHHKSSTAVAIVVPIVALGLPITDTLLAIARRYLRGAPLFRGDRQHIHHRLLARGLTQRQTVLVLYGASVLLGLLALAIAATNGVGVAVALGALALGGGLALRRLGYVQVERALEVLELRRHNVRRRDSIEAIASQLTGAAEVGAVWGTVQRAAPALGAACACLRVGGDDLAIRRCHAEGRDRSCTRHSLLVERPGAGVLALGWADRRAQVDRDTELAVEQLCGHLHAALQRVDVRVAANEEISVELLEPARVPDR